MSWDMGRSWLTRAPVLLAAFLLSVASLTAGVVVTLAEPAHAASLGEVRLSQQAGTVDSVPMFTSGTTDPCPANFGENANLRIGRPDGPYSNLAPALGGGGFDTAPITINPNRSFQTALGGTAPGAGEWWVVMECYSLTEGRNVDEFRTPITVCGDRWQVGPSCSSTANPTTTTLTVEPNTPSVPVGTAVTLTAHVTPTDAAGHVVFRRKTQLGSTEETVQLGDPVTVANGTAAKTISDLPGPSSGSSLHHTLTAEFVPDNPDQFLGSTSPAQPLDVVPAGGAATTTLTLDVEPKSPQPVDATLTLTATVTPPTAVGKVQFARQGAAGSAAIPFGDPVDLASGSATKTTGPMPQGIWSLVATFQPTDPAAFLPSNDSIADFRIGDAVATPTTTQLAVSPDSPQLQGTPVTLTAAIQPNNPAGTVKFFDGATQIGDTQTVSGGSATFATSQLAVGTHSLKAAFTPADAATFAASESTVTQFEITAPPEGGEDLTVLDASGNELGANPSLHQGDTVTVIGRGFGATESVSVKLDGTELTTVTASDGVAQYDFTVPSDAAEGAHQLLLDGASHQVEFDFTVAAGGDGGGGGGGGGGGSLPTTGLPLVGIGLAGVAMVGLGLAARLAARRREQPAPVAWSDAAPRPE
jgi:Bacterial Ig-like domain (group 3)